MFKDRLGVACNLNMIIAKHGRYDKALNALLTKMTYKK
jgi:hypothetical protein